MRGGEDQDAAAGGDRRSAMLVSKRFEDLVTVVNGKEDDKIGMKPFEKTLHRTRFSHHGQSGICSLHLELYQK